MAPPRIDLSLVAILASCVFVVWRVRARVRRFIGRQPIRPLRCWLTVSFFAVLVIGLLIGSPDHPAQSMAELLGVAIGVGLAVYGIRVTRFELTPHGMYYTPSVHIGVALSLLLVARVAYRSTQAYFSTAGFSEPPASFARSPLTLLIVGTLAGYYAWYAVGLLRRNRSLQGQGAQPSQGREEA
jgi:hypothetical protein